MVRGRLTDTARLVALVVLEAAAIPLLRQSGEGAPAIDWGHLGRWLSTTAPDDAVIAVVRLAGMALAVWLLATTVLYLLARLSRVPALVHSIEWATLPGVRRVVDAAVAASIVGGAVLGPHPAGAQVPAPPPVVVELDATTTTRPAHLYVPVPAGDRVIAPTTTALAAPRTTRAPATVTTSPPARPDPAAPAAAAPSAHLHTVVAGDNLWTIAAAELARQIGRTAEADVRDYWLQVIEANRGRLISGDPNLIYPGESIVCPVVG